MTTKTSGHRAAKGDEVPVVEAKAPPGADIAPATDTAAQRLRETRRVVDLDVYNPAKPPASKDLAVVAQAKIRLGDVEYGPGTRLTLAKQEAERLIADGLATRG